MKCYGHPEQDALGICKACNKGVCAECSHDTGNGLACKLSCIKEVEELNEVVDRSKKIYSIGVDAPAVPSAALVYFMFAALFCGWSGYIYISKGAFQGFPMALGVVMGFIGVLTMKRHRKLMLNC